MGDRRAPSEGGGHGDAVQGFEARLAEVSGPGSDRTAIERDGEQEQAAAARRERIAQELQPRLNTLELHCEAHLALDLSLPVITPSGR